MGLKLSKPIADARITLSDTDQTGYRYSDVDLLGFANDALDEIMVLAPFYFHKSAEFTCTPNKCLQDPPWNDAAELVEITSIKDGPALTLVERLIMDRLRPSWLQDSAALPVHWMRVESNPLMFFLYPRPLVGTVLNAIYVKVPGEFAADADTGLPKSLEPAIADYIVYRAESRDDEHVISQRASMFLSTFVGRFQKAEKPLFKKEV
jgi:hypothetical protein